MSTCISRHGEYGDHVLVLDPFECDRCGVFDHDAARARIEQAEADAEHFKALSRDARETAAEAIDERDEALAARDAAEAKVAAAERLAEDWAAMPKQDGWAPEFATGLLAALGKT